MIKYILDFEDIPGPTTLSFLHIFNPLSSNGDLNIWARDQIEAPKCCLHTHQALIGEGGGAGGERGIKFNLFLMICP